MVLFCYGKLAICMSNEYKNNHYVPEWYQDRFLPPEQKQKELFYLDLQPRTFSDPNGIIRTHNQVRREPFRNCFSEDDLYTTNFGSVESRIIEKQFFGEIDRRGQRAVDYFSNFDHSSIDGDAFNDIMLYMSTQKLRTPKGLDWISKEIEDTNRHRILRSMLRLRQIHCAIWTESVWLIADASQSATKFILSDHPVTVYNRVCGPRSQRCRGSNDPEIWLNGTHTIFPLSLEKVLILTNLSWVRNPYQSETSLRPNPAPFRSTIFKFHDVQILRHLQEQEVIDINYIIKRRAYHHIAAAKKEWLYPEKRISTIKWNEFGNGYLLMPDPRSVELGGQIIIGHSDGTASAYDEYGHRPGQMGYDRTDRRNNEGETLYRFKGEFARLIGPYRRGRSFQTLSLVNERDNEEFHKYHLGLEKRKRSS